MLAYPDFIDLSHCLFHNFRVICQDASLEVTSRFCFHADAGTCEVRTANIHLFTVKDKHLKVNTWTEHPLQTVKQYWELVKVLAEVRSRFFCMNQPHLHPHAE